MNAITIAVYLILTGWALYEATVTYISHQELRGRRVKKLTQTLFTLLILFLIGHFIIIAVTFSPEWTVPEFGLWVYYGFNYGLLKGMHVLRLEILE